MPKRRISRLLYFLIVSSVTEIILLSLAGIALIPTGYLRDLTTVFLAGYSIYYAVKTALLLSFFSRWNAPEYLTRIAGMLPGRIVGLFTGLLLGYKLGSIPIAVIGSILFYLFFRWLGGYISIKVTKVLADKIELQPMQEAEGSVISKSTMRLVFFVFLMMTILFVPFISLLEWQDIRFTANPTILNCFRIYALVVSLVMVALPRYQNKRVFSNQKLIIVNPEFTVFLIGLAFSYIPTVFGLILYILGAHFYEAILYILFSLICSSLWAIQEFRLSNPLA